jgi:hypothetical protein
MVKKDECTYTESGSFHILIIIWLCLQFRFNAKTVMSVEYVDYCLVHDSLGVVR